MIRQITSFNPHKTALTVALVMSIGSLLFVVPMALLMSFIPEPPNQANHPNGMMFPGFFFLCMPVFYFIFGYLFTAFSAWIYNKIARFTGGIEFVLSE